MAHLNVKFILKDKRSNKKTLIMLRANKGVLDFRFSTRLKIEPKYWNSDDQKPITETYERLKRESRLDSIQTGAKDEYLKAITEAKKANPDFIEDMRFISIRLQKFITELNAIYSYLINQHNYTSEEQLRLEMIKKFFPDLAERKKSSDVDLYNCFDDFLEVKKQELSELTIKKYNTLKNRLKEFEGAKNYRITFESINLDFYDKFKSYLLRLPNKRTEEAKGLLDDTISKYFSSIKSFMQWSLDREYHSNTKFQHRKFSAKKKAKHEVVPLTEIELMKIYQLDLSGNIRLENVRDLFCFGCFTGQRWSDYSRFDKKDIIDNSWKFTTQKTKEIITIPFVGFANYALQILEKTDYKFKKISSQRFNDYIKEVCELAGIEESTTIKRWSGKNEIKITKPKYDFIVSHTARRTFITILLQKGVPITTVQKITGHKSVKTLMKYVETSDDAVIEALEKT